MSSIPFHMPRHLRNLGAMADPELGVKPGDQVVLKDETTGVRAGSKGIVIDSYRSLERKVLVVFPAIGALLALTADMFERL